MRRHEGRYRFHHCALFLQSLLSGNGKHAPAITVAQQHRGTFAAEEVAAVVCREPGNFEHVERTGEIAGKAQQMLEPLRLEHKIAQSPRLEVLLDVGLEPYLKHADGLVLQVQRNVQEREWRLVRAGCAARRSVRWLHVARIE